jgi:hypothetical protein
MNDVYLYPVEFLGTVGIHRNCEVWPTGTSRRTILITLGISFESKFGLTHRSFNHHHHFVCPVEQAAAKRDARQRFKPIFTVGNNVQKCNIIKGARFKGYLDKLKWHTKLH